MGALPAAVRAHAPSSALAYGPPRRLPLDAHVRRTQSASVPSVRLIERSTGYLDRNAATRNEEPNRVGADVEERIASDHLRQLREQRSALADRAGDSVDLDDAALVLRLPVELEGPDRPV